jgi:two-component system probable response regulator PhcQ
MKAPKVLVVDDEEQIRKSLERVLVRDGYEVLQAENPRQAIDMLQGQSVAVVISDYMMPGMDGLTFLKSIKKVYPDTIRIILTGKGDMAAVVAAINEGEVYRFILKPWDNDELRISLRRAIEQRELMLENRHLVETVREQREEIHELEKTNPGITKINKSRDGAIVIDEDEVEELEKTNPGEYIP